MTLELLEDPEFREEIAEAAYLRHRAEQAAYAREHDLDVDAAYYAVGWEWLSNETRHAYRAAVAEALEHVIALEAA